MPPSSRSTPPRDVSQQTKVELARATAESVAAAGTLARLLSKTSTSPALQSTIVAFAEHEQTIESTNEMLHRVNEGMMALDEAVEAMSVSLAPEPVSSAPPT